MSLDISGIKAELDSIVNEATGFADIVAKYEDLVGKIANLIPGVSDAQAQEVVTVIADLDKALHEAQSVLADL